MFHNSTLGMVELETLVDGLPDFEVMTDPQALSGHRRVTSGQDLGFATAMSKVVLNKGAGEVVGMARSNMRNLPAAESRNRA